MNVFSVMTILWRQKMSTCHQRLMKLLGCCDHKEQDSKPHQPSRVSNQALSPLRPTMAAPLCLLSGLPSDALNHAVSFLNSKDALQLSELNSSFREALSLSTLHDPTPLITRNTWYGTRDEGSSTPRRSVWIPVLFPHRTHSVVLTCKWRDQGFGNRKGALFVVAVPVNDDPNTEMLESIENGKTVYASPIAPHEEESLRISFSCSPSMAYYLWYRVGGGGGHQLGINNLMMHTVIHDCSGKWIGRNYDALESQGFLQNNDTFSLGMLRLIAAVGQEENTKATTTYVESFLNDTGFDMSEASMKALAEVATALLDHQRQKSAHAVLRNQNPRVGRVPLQRMDDVPPALMPLHEGILWEFPPVALPPVPDQVLAAANVMQVDEGIEGLEQLRDRIDAAAGFEALRNEHDDDDEMSEIE